MTASSHHCARSTQGQSEAGAAASGRRMQARAGVDHIAQSLSDDDMANAAA